MHFLIFAEEFGLADDLVDERGLAVVHVRDDGDVSDVLHEDSEFPESVEK